MRSTSKESQDRIVDAAEMPNYSPNFFALVAYHEAMIEVLVPELSERYRTLVLSGIEYLLLWGGPLLFSGQCIIIARR